MYRSARLYQCCRCHAQVIICSACDRGHRYCTGDCAAAARSDHLKRAGKKYQSTRAGRVNNAARQQRYRARQRQKVTHQGSLPTRACDVLKNQATGPEQVKKQRPMGADVICHHCGAVCEPFLRPYFLQQRRFDVDSGIHPLLRSEYDH